MPQKPIRGKWLRVDAPEWEAETRWTSLSDVDQRVVFVGDDLEGVALEVIAAELEEDEFMVIHAMDLRERLRELYEEARSWEK